METEVISIEAHGSRAGKDQFSQKKISVLCLGGWECIVGGQKPTQIVVYRWFAKAFFFFTPVLLRVPFVVLITVAAPETPYFSRPVPSFCR